jgi:Ring finger domain
LRDLQPEGTRDTRTVMTQAQYARLIRLNQGWLHTSRNTTPGARTAKLYHYIYSRRPDTTAELVAGMATQTSRVAHRDKLLIDIPWTRYMDVLRYWYSQTRPNKVDESERSIVVRNVDIPTVVSDTMIGLPRSIGDIQMAIHAHSLIEPLQRELGVQGLGSNRYRNDRLYELMFSALSAVREIAAAGPFFGFRPDSAVSYELETNLGKERFDKLSQGLASAIHLRSSQLMYPGFKIRSTIPSNMGFLNYASNGGWPQSIVNPFPNPSRPLGPVIQRPGAFVFGRAERVPRFPSSCEVKLIRVPHNFEYPQQYARFRDCVICQIDFTGQEEVVALQCVHVFHAQCAQSWFATQRSPQTCPTCRQPCSN